MTNLDCSGSVNRETMAFKRRRRSDEEEQVQRRADRQDSPAGGTGVGGRGGQEARRQRAGALHLAQEIRRDGHYRRSGRGARLAHAHAVDRRLHVVVDAARRHAATFRCATSNRRSSPPPNEYLQLQSNWNASPSSKLIGSSLRSWKIQMRRSQRGE